MIPIAVFGAEGRMGKLIQSEAGNGVEVIQTIDQGSPVDLLPEVKVIVDFSLPQAWESLHALLSQGNQALVSGTTGIQEEHFRLLEKWSDQRPVFYSSNMSVGIHVLGKLMAQADKMLGDSFDRELVEIHHSRKVDSPSGTALTLLKNWSGLSRTPGVHSIRGGDVTGEHQLHYLGQGEKLVLSHTATDRKVFALGALRAVEFIAGRKPGLYGMEDMLG